MGKQKNKGTSYKGQPEYKGLKGWEKNYLKKSLEYGHIQGLKQVYKSKDNK